MYASLVRKPPAPPPPECRLPAPPPPPTTRMRSDVTDGGDVHVNVEVAVNLRMQDELRVDAVTPVVELTVVAQAPVPIVAAVACETSPVRRGEMTRSAARRTAAPRVRKELLVLVVTFLMLCCNLVALVAVNVMKKIWGGEHSGAISGGSWR